jgi:hypothetical protein
VGELELLADRGTSCRYVAVGGETTCGAGDGEKVCLDWIEVGLLAGTGNRDVCGDADWPVPVRCGVMTLTFGADGCRTVGMGWAVGAGLLGAVAGAVEL